MPSLRPGTVERCAFARAESFQQPGFNVTIDGNSSPLSSAVINIGSSGANTVIAGQTNKIIRVYRLAMVPLTSVTATIKDGSTSLSGPMPLGANQELNFQLRYAALFYWHLWQSLSSSIYRAPFRSAAWCILPSTDHANSSRKSSRILF